MKIIKRGVCLKKDELAFICSECGCYFVAWADECDAYLCHKCPDCSAKVYPFKKMQKEIGESCRVIGRVKWTEEDL